MSEQEHEHDESCEGQQPNLNAFPAQEWNWLEIPAIICRVSAATARAVGAGLDALAFEIQTAASWQREARQQAREQWEADIARAEMAGTLDGLVLFDEPHAIDPRDLP